LPTISSEFSKLAREATKGNEGYVEYLLRLTELVVANRTANTMTARIKGAGFPVMKDFDSYDFSLTSILNKHKMLELAQSEWIDQHFNCCLIGSPGTGKTHLAIVLALAACRQGRRVRFFTAAVLVNRLEEAQKQYQLEKLLRQLDKTDLLVCDELGYITISRRGAELRFQGFTDRYERSSLVITSNLSFAE